MQGNIITAYGRQCPHGLLFLGLTTPDFARVGLAQSFRPSVSSVPALPIGQELKFINGKTAARPPNDCDQPY